MKFMRKLLILTALISAFLAVYAFAADEATDGLLISPAPTQAAQETAEETIYPDVPEDASYADSVYKLSQAGVLNGYEDGTWRPEGEVTRAEMAKMVILTFGLAEDYEKADGFPDVLETDWFYPYVLAIQNKDLVEGYENGDFRPKNSITRAEVCTIIYRVFEDDGDKKKVLDISPFIPGMPERTVSDLADNHWAKKYVNAMVNNYLMPLEENNTFRPTENIKRYELADLLAKFVIVEPVETLTAEIKFYNGEELWKTDIIAVGDVPVAPEEIPEAEAGYAFKGWKVKGQTGTNTPDFATITEPGTYEFEAVFVKEWTVSFYNGEVLHDVQKVLDGGYAKEPADPKWPESNTSMEFVGWSFEDDLYVEDADVIDVSKYRVKKNLELFARYNDTSAGPDIGDSDEPTNPNSSELMDKLDKGAFQLGVIRDEKTENLKIKFICTVLIETLDEIMASAENGKVITKSYIQTYYKDLIAELKSYILYGYEDDEGNPAGTILLNHPSRPTSTTGFSGAQANDFKNLLGTYVDDDVQDFIIDYFDLQKDLDNLQKS